MRRIAIPVLLALVGASCSGQDGDGSPRSGERLSVEVASFDLAVGIPGRFLVGLVTQGPQGNLYVAGGSVDLDFFYLGEAEATGRDPAGSATAAFLPIPGSTGPYPARPESVTASTGRGVYAVDRFEFDRPGFWEVEVQADLAGEGTQRATGAFEVLAEPEVPVPGDPAPRTENLTIDTYQADGAPPQAVDSRATSERIPDRALHDSTVADAIRSGHPVLLTISTPVYCVSKFCGPITDLVAELGDEYGDRAEFIHIEVWRNFEEQVVNRAAAEWILAEDKLQEPWVF
ncbi:MAG: hypothetical protein M3135_08520, partial [Actinomycetota bacterium]|nr:hypothetical protein [Actinomycetota bacterium]